MVSTTLTRIVAITKTYCTVDKDGQLRKIYSLRAKGDGCPTRNNAAERVFGDHSLSRVSNLISIIDATQPFDMRDTEKLLRNTRHEGLYTTMCTTKPSNACVLHARIISAFSQQASSLFAGTVFKDRLDELDRLGRSESKF